MSDGQWTAAVRPVIIILTSDGWKKLDREEPMVPFKHSTGMHCAIIKENRWRSTVETLDKEKYGMHDAEMQNYILQQPAWT